MADRKDPVTRFLEFLRFRTVSGEGPQGSYAEVSSGQSASTFRWVRIVTCVLTALCSYVCALLRSARTGCGTTWKRVRGAVAGSLLLWSYNVLYWKGELTRMICCVCSRTVGQGVFAN